MALSTPAVDLTTEDERGVKVKQEHEETAAADLIVRDPQLSGLQSRNVTITVAASRPKVAATAQVAKPVQKAVVEEKVEEGPPPIDQSSRIGVFGWTSIGPVHLPVLMRGDEKFVAVKMFECKVVFGYFPDIFPPEIFSCTNINSYFVTESEAKLLNDINGNHCDFQFGYSTFSTKDYVVRLKDAANLFQFLECCKSKLYGSSSTVSDKCGFFLNYKIPYVRKGSKKYVCLSTIYPEDRVPPVTSTEVITNWDLAYFRLLSFFASVDLDKLELNKPLCNIEDLESALGGVRFEEVTHWPEIRLSSKEEWSSYLRSRTYQWVSKSSMQTAAEPFDDAKKLKKKISEMQTQESLQNAFLGYPKYLDPSTQVPRPAHMQSSEPLNGLNMIQSSEKASIFPVSLENFLSNPSSYSYPVNINHFNGHIQTPSVFEYERYKKSNGSTKKSRSYPPPPPLVRLNNGGSRPPDHDLVPKSPSLYSFLPGAPTAASTSCPPWYARIMEPDWLQDEHPRAASSDTPENLSREAWPPPPPRNAYDLLHGGPPHYPTPPQSSPMSLLDGGFTDMYAAATRLTPSGLCSPPPSPDLRTSPGRSLGYQQHIARWVSVDSRNVLAINIEPLKYHGHLAVPLSLVVNMFLGGVSVQSCQIMLETVFGLHLYESTSLHQEAFAKYNLTVLPGSKLILLNDLKNCIYQLKVLLLEKDKVSDKQYDLGAADLPMAKRWCGDVREC